MTRATHLSHGVEITEYEAKFVAEGKPIYRLEAYLK